MNGKPTVWGEKLRVRAERQLTNKNHRQQKREVKKVASTGLGDVGDRIYDNSEALQAHTH